MIYSRRNWPETVDGPILSGSAVENGKGTVTTLAVTALVLVSLVRPAEAAAQSCVGMPSTSGDAFAGAMVQPPAALGAEVESDGYLGAELGADVSGPLALRAQYRWKPIEGLRRRGAFSPSGDDHDMAVLGASPFEAGRWSFCPALGGELRVRSRVDRSTREIWTVPAGLGAGVELPLGGDLSLTPFIFPQALLVSAPEQRVTDTEDDVIITVTREEQFEARLDFGAVLGSGRIYGSTNFRVVSNLEGILGFDRAFEISGGVLF